VITRQLDPDRQVNVRSVTGQPLAIGRSSDDARLRGTQGT
jgi:hypothetical protein